MKIRKWIILLLCLFLVALGIFLLINRDPDQSNSVGLSIIYPFNGTLFPPEFPPPVFRWEDTGKEVSQWNITLYPRGAEKINSIITSDTKWQPSKLLWDSIKNNAREGKVYFEVSRSHARSDSRKQRPVRIYFSFSTDSVGAPILYREIPLPFAWAEEHPDSMTYRLVNVASEHPPQTVMKKFLVCGNCHSFSNDGKIMGLDFDAAHRDKGGYFIAEIKDSMIFDTSNYLSWNKMQPQKSFGMFSKISPDGRYVATTIRDRVVSRNFGYVPEKRAFSQIFFPVNGILAIYDRQTNTLKELPGANDEQYVHSNAFWTPDGKNILFVRAKALPYVGNNRDFLMNEDTIVDAFINGTRDFKFDIYTIPFNEGKGGKAKPVKGASGNGKSNYFPAVSPDGKWLIFCQSENYMLIQPDSRLYIVPLEGGKARKLKCNLYLMNSWHAWSPNSRWIVFVSKGLSIYSDMFLTHIDDKGNASYPVLIENARNSGRAANYPEFLNSTPDLEFSMIYRYVDISHIRRALIAGDTALAKNLYRQYLDQEQYSLPDEFVFLARFNVEMKNYSEAMKFVKMALEKEPGNPEANALFYFLTSRI